MDGAQPPAAERTLKGRPRLSLDAVVNLLCESAGSALLRAIVVQLLGSAALGFLGVIFSRMVPSLPPISSKPLLEAPAWLPLHRVEVFLVQNSFGVIFALLFIAIAGGRLAAYSSHPRHRRVVAFILRVHRRISGQWFRLFVRNAIAASISTLVVVAVQRFSWSHLVWTWIAQTAQPLLEWLQRAVPGGAMIGPWCAWFNLNQPKFFFWLLYSAAICDDLGLPNYKTLMRLAGRRLGLLPGRDANSIDSKFNPPESSTTGSREPDRFGPAADPTHNVQYGRSHPNLGSGNSQSVLSRRDRAN